MSETIRADYHRNRLAKERAARIAELKDAVVEAAIEVAEAYRILNGEGLELGPGPSKLVEAVKALEKAEQEGTDG